MDDFAVHASLLANEVDSRLGDSIEYAIGGANGGSYVPMKARLTSTEPPNERWKTIEDARVSWRLQINRELVPSPSRDDRITCAAIFGGDVYRPNGKEPKRYGRYWLVNLQKV